METKLVPKMVEEEIEIIELDERLDLAADPLMWLAYADNNTVSGCSGCNCPCGQET